MGKFDRASIENKNKNKQKTVLLYVLLNKKFNCIIIFNFLLNFLFSLLKRIEDNKVKICVGTILR